MRSRCFGRDFVLGVLAAVLALGGPGTGRAVTIVMEKLDVRDALTMVAREAGFNLVFGPGVEGTLSLELREVEPREALRTIVKDAGLHGRTVPGVEGAFVITRERLDKVDLGAAPAGDGWAKAVTLKSRRISLANVIMALALEAGGGAVVAEVGQTTVALESTGLPSWQLLRLLALAHGAKAVWVTPSLVAIAKSPRLDAAFEPQAGTPSSPLALNQRTGFTSVGLLGLLAQGAGLNLDVTAVPEVPVLAILEGADPVDALHATAVALGLDVRAKAGDAASFVAAP